jgi:hypothetical protein
MGILAAGCCYVPASGVIVFVGAFPCAFMHCFGVYKVMYYFSALMYSASSSLLLT